MSAYDDIPADFPVNIQVKQRPLTYVLDIDTPQKVLFVGMSLFWLLFVPFFILIPVMSAEAADPLAPWMTYTLVTLAILYVVLASRYWLWNNVTSCFNRVSITIGTESVDVEKKSLFATQTWSQPISSYQGVAIEDRGRQTVGNAAEPILAVILKHADDDKSVPLVIDLAQNVKPTRLPKIAAELRVPVIEAIVVPDHAATYPPGTLVVSKWQSFKVRALNYAFIAATLVFAGIALYQSGWGTLDPTYPILLVPFAAAIVGMHIYARRYVVSARKGPAHDEITITTAAALANTHIVKIADIKSAKHHEGRMTGAPGDPSVHAPWVNLYVSGSTLPFVIDMQSDYIDKDWLSRFAQPG